MTLQSATSRMANYTGDGSTVSFAYSFKIFLASDLLVTKQDTLGVVTPLALTTDYTVQGAGSATGGTVVLNVAPATGVKISIRRKRPLTQLTDIRNQGDFYPQVHEDEFDLLVMQDQQQQDELDRSFKLPETVAPASFSPTLPATLVGQASVAIGTNPSGTGMAVGPSFGDVANAAANATAAAASAGAAAGSATAAAGSATAAAGSATAAAGSATSAATSLSSLNSQKGAANGIATLDGSGLVPITQMPPAAIERLVVVADQTARFALTTATAQNGDTIKQTDTGQMYFVIDQTNLGNSAGYSVYVAGSAATAAALTSPNPINMGGTGQTTKAAAFDALSPNTTKGDITAFSTSNLRLAVGSDGQVLTADSAQTQGMKWAAVPSAPTNPYDLNNLGLATSVASSALTIALKQSDGSTDPSAGAPVKMGFRSSTASAGGYNTRSVTAALSLVIPSTTTLGHASGAQAPIYLYALDNAGTVELAVSCKWYDEKQLQSTTGGGSGSTLAAGLIGTALYSVTARTNVPIRLLAILLSTQTTAGTWAAVPTVAGLATMGSLSPIVEYAYNSDTTNATNTGSFAWGSGGSQIPNVSASAKTKRVQWPTPAVDGEIVLCELFMVTQWAPLGATPTLVVADGTNGIYYGDTGGAGTSYTDVIFGPNRTAGLGWAGIVGSNSYKWRMVKYPRRN